MIEQALFCPDPGHGWLAHSPGFRAEWRPTAERICAEFGSRQSEASCPLCLFALPFDGGQVLVCQASDRTPGLFFRLLVLSRPHYRNLGGEPFHLVDQLAPLSWDARGELPPLPWDHLRPSAARNVDAIRQILDVPHSPTLLGGVQALIDGDRLVFERNSPADDLVRDLWKLLPLSTRSEIWPATFAYGNALHFNVVVVPRAVGPEFEQYLTEENLGDYPEGSYERALQSATESGNQAELDGLFARRSRSQTFWLGVLLLIVFVVVALIIGW